MPGLDFREGNIEPWVERTGAVNLDPKIARRLVAGGVWFGRQNGFRMPPEWEKFIAIFGRDILNKIPTADVDDFGIDGGLRYVGTMDFLQKRLTVPAAEFFARPNVHYVIETEPGASEPEEFGDSDEDESDLDEETIERIGEVTDIGAAKIAEKAREWCAAHGAPPIPMLDEAAQIVMMSMLPLIEIGDSGREPTDEELSQARRLGEFMLMQYSPAERYVLGKAVDRIRECMDGSGRIVRPIRLWTVPGHNHTGPRP